VAAGLAAAGKLQNFGLNVVLIDKQKLADI